MSMGMAHEMHHEHTMTMKNIIVVHAYKVTIFPKHQKPNLHHFEHMNKTTRAIIVCHLVR